MVNATPTGTMTIVSPTIKGQKVGGGPVSENLHPFSIIVGIILSFMMYNHFYLFLDSSCWYFVDDFVSMFTRDFGL